MHERGAVADAVNDVVERSAGKPISHVELPARLACRTGCSRALLA